MAKKSAKEILLENIDKAIVAIGKINAKGCGWDIESCIASSRNELVQAKGLINKK